MGYRGFDDNDRFGGEHVRDSGITVLDYREVRAGTIDQIPDQALATVTKPEVQGFWVPFDVDVLDDAIMPAVDYRLDGGLTWDEAAELVQGLLGQPGASGLEVTRYISVRASPWSGSNQVLRTTPHLGWCGVPAILLHSNIRPDKSDTGKAAVAGRARQGIDGISLTRDTRG